MTGARPRARRKNGWTTRIIVGVLIVAAVALLPRALKKKPLKVKTVRVERATVRDMVTSSTAGEVVPLKKATVRAELGARVVAVKKSRGDRVKKGEPIVVLDALDLDARIAQAQATVAANQAQVAQAQARVATVTRSAERARALAEKGAGTSQLAEDAEAQLREAKEAIRAAEGLRAQAEAAVRVARVARQKAQLDAPFDGLIVELKLDPGEELAPGAPVFEIIDDTKLRVDASIDEADVAKVKAGQPASLRLDALPGKNIKAVVAKLAPSVRRDLKGARTLAIEVDVVDVKQSMSMGLRPGMSADVEIVVSEKPDVPSLPTNVIVGRGAKRSVFAIEDGKAKSRDIEVGVSNWDRTEVLSGVAPGVEVISSLNTKDLAEGVTVQAEK